MNFLTICVVLAGTFTAIAIAWDLLKNNPKKN